MTWPDLIAGLVPVLGTLGGVLAGSLLEQRRVRLAFERERLGRDTELLRLKLEELYLEVEELQKSITALGINLIQLAGLGKVVQKQEVQGDAYKISMLVGIYAPELGPELEALNRARDGFAKAVVDFMSNPKAGNPQGIVKVTVYVVRVAEAAKRFQEQVAVSAAKTLMRVPMLKAPNTVGRADG
jgi:hypothetical protein